MTGRAEDEDRVDSRAELLPEEQEAGSEDAHHQAEEILRESDERTLHPEETGAESTQTSTPRVRPSVLSPDERAAELAGGRGDNVEEASTDG